MHRVGFAAFQFPGESLAVFILHLELVVDVRVLPDHLRDASFQTDFLGRIVNSLAQMVRKQRSGQRKCESKAEENMTCERPPAASIDASPYRARPSGRPSPFARGIKVSPPCKGGEPPAQRRQGVNPRRSYHHSLPRSSPAYSE